MDISKAICPDCGGGMKLIRARCPDCDVTLDGDFEISGLAKLPQEDQLFVVAFLRGHGSIKRMEALFGISYPTVKNRLGAIVTRLDQEFQMPTPNSAILERLSRGEISVDEALEGLE